MIICHVDRAELDAGLPSFVAGLFDALQKRRQVTSFEQPIAVGRIIATCFERRQAARRLRLFSRTRSICSSNDRHCRAGWYEHGKIYQSLHGRDTIAATPSNLESDFGAVN
jgi:hypothetical protein